MRGQTIRANTKGGVSFRCPYCGRDVEALLEVEHPRGGPPGPAIVHRSPACSTFMRLEPAAYMRAVRGKLAPS